MIANRFRLPNLLSPKRERAGLVSNRHRRFQGAQLLVPVAACVLAVFLGLLATTLNPILIGLVVGAFLGFGLLGFPAVTLWLVLAGTLFIGGMIAQFLPGLNKANWLFSMLGFLLFASTIVAGLMRHGPRAHLPWWAWLALLFPAYAIAGAVINQISIWEFLAGFKRYFQYWGVFACLAMLALPQQTYQGILKFVIGLGLVQVFFAIYQRILVVPQRVGMGGGVVAIDAVSGTFESSFTGGGSSSVLVFFVLIIFAFVFRLWLDGKLSGVRAGLASVLLLAPLALGETKVVVAFLPMVFFCVLMLDFRRNPIRTIGLLLLGLLGTLALGLLYLVISAKAGQSLSAVFDSIVSYNFGKAGYHSANNLNRTTVFTFWWSQQHAGDPLGLLLGHGPGSSYSGDGALVPGQLAMHYYGLAIAFTTLSSLLWDYGVIGLLGFLLFNLGAAWAMMRVALRSQPSLQRSLAVAVLVGLLMNLLLTFMGNSATTLPSHSTLYMLLLGAAVLLRRPTGGQPVHSHA